MRHLVVALAALVLVSGCSHVPGMGSKASPHPSAAAVKPTGTPLARATGQLDAEVPLPPGFPADVPVYPKARLTAGASFVSSGEVTWGMEWESLDAANRVAAYYVKQLAGAGDWTLTVTNSGNGVLTGTLVRKSDSHETGILAITNDVTVTMIALSLVSSG